MLLRPFFLVRKGADRWVGRRSWVPWNGWECDRSPWMGRTSGRLKVGRRLGIAVIRLDYLSCLLTVLSTVLVGRKRWTGLVVACVNSVIFCVIGIRTGQIGFIPANLFCIGVYAVSIRSWVRAEGSS